MSIQLSDPTGDQVRRRFSRYTDHELIAGGQTLQRFCRQKDPNHAFAVQLEVAREIWRERLRRRRAGVGICFCHVPGKTPLTPNAQMKAANPHWRGPI